MCNKRNPKEDLRLCNEASPGEWGWFYLDEEGGGGLEPIQVAMYARPGRRIWLANNNGGTNFFMQISNNGIPSAADLKFIAESKPALLYWINRALELEKENARSTQQLLCIERISKLHEKYSHNNKHTTKNGRDLVG